MADMDKVETIYSEYDGQVISGKTGRFVIRHRNVKIERCTVTGGLEVEMPDEDREGGG